MSECDRAAPPITIEMLREVLLPLREGLAALNARLEAQGSEMRNELRAVGHAVDGVGGQVRKLFHEQGRTDNMLRSHLQAHAQDPQELGEARDAWDPDAYNPYIANERAIAYRHRWRILAGLGSLALVILGAAIPAVLPHMPQLRGLLP